MSFSARRIIMKKTRGGVRVPAWKIALVTGAFLVLLVAVIVLIALLFFVLFMSRGGKIKG